MRRAQTEIVGLLIIVIMISFMVLFAVSVMFEPPEDDIDSYLQNSIPSRFVGGILRTDSRCVKGFDMRELIIDCAKSPELGGSMDLTCEDGKRTCEYMKGVLDGILQGTFESVQKPYELRIYDPDKQLIYTRNCSAVNGCLSASKVRSDTYNQWLNVPYRGNMQILMCMPEC
jgi:hypothetical protein